LTADERTEVERRVNERVFENLPVRIFETPIEEARTLGAMMLFGEKYGDIVRVVDIGGWSVELCGGTHVRSTAEIGPFVVLSEASVGSGARRIEAVTSGEAFALLHERAREADVLRGELEKSRKQSNAPKQETSYELGERVDGVVFAQTQDLQPGPLRDLSDRIRQQEKADGAIVISVSDGRVHIVVNLDPSLGVDASKVAVEMGEIVGGRGGGKATMAQAGGNAPGEIPGAIAAAKKAFA
jgi:alanyl-tRNA synthetase